jgi:hypothetical protein
MTIQKEEDEEDTDKIQYGTVTIPYSIIRSKRIKTSGIIVDADNITIRTPLNKGISEIRKLLFRQGKLDNKKTKRIQSDGSSNSKT